MSYDQLIRKHHSFHPIALAIYTVGRTQKIEKLEQKLMWKTLEIIKHASVSTAQWILTLN